MSSSRASTPATPLARSRDASPILTPRSKIRAFVASLDTDDSSDDDASDRPSKPTDASVPAKSPAMSPAGKHPARETPLFASLPGVTSDDDDDEEPVMRPRGKMASRMRARDEPQTAQSPVPSRQDKGDAAPEAQDTAMKEVDDDDELYALPPQPQATPPRGNYASAYESPKETDSDEDELPEKPLQNARFLELVAKKKKEREEKEAAERKKREERAVPVSEVDDEKTPKRKAPRRQAGKKAVEEMHKETQRMARNMQLAHQARTRKKITKQSLFDKFNFKPDVLGEALEEPFSKDSTKANTKKANPPATDSSSTLAASDGEPTTQSTPGSSPPPDTIKETPAPQVHFDSDEELPDKLSDFVAKVQANSRKAQSPKGKGKAPAVEMVTPRPDKGKGRAITPKAKNLPGPPVRVNLPIRSVVIDDSDSELEFVDLKPNPKSPTAEKQQLLASLHRSRKSIVKPPAVSPGKVQMTAKQLQARLVKQSREQAAREREEKIEELRAKGVIILTAEERDKERKEVENLVENARQDALKIQKRERKAAKKREEREKGVKMEGAEKADEDENEDEEAVYIPSDEELMVSDEDEDSLESSEDEEEKEGVESEQEGKDVDPSKGSDNDTEMREIENKDDQGTPAPTFSLSSMAEPRSTPRLSDMPVAYIEDENSDSDDGGFAPLQRKVQRKTCVVNDDDEPTTEVATEIATEVATERIAPPAPRIPSIFAKAAVPQLGMSQLFAASAPAATADGLDVLRQGPVDELPNSQQPLSFDDYDDEDNFIPETQAGKLDLSYSQDYGQDSLGGLDLHYSQPQELLDATMPDPTPDQGFERSLSPAPPRFLSPEATPAPPGTVATQILDEQFPESAKKIPRRKLIRRTADFSDEESASDSGRNAFAVMKKAARKPKSKPKPDFDKSKSDAKGLVHEQASESEDEYAGLGGASDDDSASEGALDAEMADLLDESHQDVNENELAALYAAREKARDEQNVNKLFRDLQSGGLMRRARKRGAGGFDLDDSDDEYLALERRRRAKRRQVLQVRRELLKDKDVQRIAADPKKAAFFRTLEDRESDVEGTEDFLGSDHDDADASDDPELAGDDTQSQSVHPPLRSSSPIRHSSPPSQQPRKVSPAADDAVAMPPPPPPALSRRTKPRSKKAPPSLAAVREQLSFLTEDSPMAAINALHDGDSDSDEDSVSAPRRCVVPIIDRSRTLSRTNSVDSAYENLAFRGAADADAPGFRVPTLARRATTQTVGALTGGATAGPMAITERSLGKENPGAATKPGSRGGSIHFIKERAKVAVQERAVEKMRKREKMGAARRGVLGGTVFGEGKFE